MVIKTQGRNRMQHPAIIALVNNATLLMSLSVIYELTYLLYPRFRFKQIVNGLLVAVICIAIMAMPFTLTLGVLIDSRSILISVTALIFGLVPTIVTVVAAIAFRVFLGGAGALPGVAIIISSAIVGLVWRRWLYPKATKLRLLSVYAMGVFIHIIMLVCMNLLPYPDSTRVIREIAFPILLIYPVATVLLCLLLNQQQILGQMRDQRKQAVLRLIMAEQALKESEEKYCNYIENAPYAVFVVDENGDCLEANRAASTITGYNREEILGMNIRDFATANSMDEAVDRFKSLLEKGKVSTELKYIHKNGEDRWWTIDAVKIADNQFLGYSIDITDRKRAELNLVNLSKYDYLTGIYNRMYFETELENVDIENQLPLSVMFGDINGVKLINDAFGHAVGDKLIAESAMIMKNCCRDGDIIARIGGDEFGFLLPKTDLATADEILRKIQTALEGFDANNHNESYKHSVSLGYATKTSLGEDIKETIKKAEGYMYQRKLLEHNSAHSTIVFSIKTTLYEKSQETEEHAERLVTLTKAVGLALGLSQIELDKLELLATLHDIGKVAINNDILIKPGALNEMEWAEMKRHPEIGYRIAMTSPELVPIAEGILYHQEWWDGRGYPRGLRGNHIPLLSRIVAVADAYDAMTNDRPYRKGLDHKEAIERIKQGAGSQFDPQIAGLFTNIFS
jgi:diguanylate cyclase (GGDEF)-like protein/PAS domain S-box-containing protein